MEVVEKNQSRILYPLNVLCKYMVLNRIDGQ